MDVYVDGALVTTWTSSGTTIAPESILFTETSGQVVELTGVLADSEWLSIIEVRYLNECGSDIRRWKLSRSPAELPHAVPPVVP